MDRINTISGTISTLVGKVSQGIVVVMAIRSDRLRLHSRSLRMRHLGAMCMGYFMAGLYGIKPTLALATAWKQPEQACRLTSPNRWRSAWRPWALGSRAAS
jgi:hypothetical protein